MKGLISLETTISCAEGASSRSSREKFNPNTSSGPEGAHLRIFFAALRLCVRFQKPPNADHLSSVRRASTSALSAAS
jgi:hypothetical protein